MREVYTTKDRMKSKRMIKKQRISKQITYLVLFAFVISVFCFTSSGFVKTFKTTAAMRNENKALIVHRSELEKQNAELMERKNYLRSERGTIRSARENDYIKPGERMIIFTGEKK